MFEEFHQGPGTKSYKCDAMRLSSGAETKKAVEEEDDQQAQRASRHSGPSRVESVKSSQVKSSQVKSRARRDREADKDRE